MNIEIQPFFRDQQQIKVYGRRVGYCGTKPNMPICFLTESKQQCGLTADEKTEVIAFVIDEMGSVKKTRQTAPFWPLTEQPPEHKEQDEQEPESG